MITGNLSEAEDDCLVSQQSIENLARIVQERQLSVPAIFILEMYKPLASVLVNIAIITYPLLMPLFGSDKYSEVLKVVRSREAIERLILRLEQKDSKEVAG